MGLLDLTASAVNQAIQEFDLLKRKAFLKKYKFGRAREYLLRKDGRSYDSKAIAGAAHGYLSGQAPLTAKEFSGGEATVKKRLEELGFVVTKPEQPTLPSSGDVLTNAEISQRFGVGAMSGMRFNSKRNLLVLISDPFKGLYQDRWEGDILHYTGMGKSGHQSLTFAQNKTLNESPSTAVHVHLLEAMEPFKYTYAGEVELTGAPYQEEQLDETKQERLVWMFPIRLKPGGAIPVLTEEQARVIEGSHAEKARQLTDNELKARAKMAKGKPATRTAQTTAYVRDAAVAEYAKRLANGKCDLCEMPAPFQNGKNEHYLECHHIVWLAKGGEDTIANTVALCPNCHRKMHVLNRKIDKEKLSKRAAEKEHPAQ
ncbi:HNH endonuclease signature motif containing protein [Bradyrhizobium sp. 27S5]|uniref:HNH endonuclease n=1 Tax=Bradyrhizobium sp. 27S5 TaxID=3139728 RepID=UPI0030D29E1A